MKLSVHGYRVIPMQVTQPSRRDLVDHTVRHFLQPTERFETVEPHPDWQDDSPTPEQVRVHLHASGHNVPLLGTHAPTPATWWRNPPLDVVRRAHDEGYYPRYASLVQRAGAPDARLGALWHHAVEHQDRLVADVDGYRVVATTRVDAGGTRTVRVITAHRLGGVGGDRVEGLGTFARAMQQAGIA